MQFRILQRGDKFFIQKSITVTIRYGFLWLKKKVKKTWHIVDFEGMFIIDEYLECLYSFNSYDSANDYTNKILKKVADTERKNIKDIIHEVNIT